MASPAYKRRKISPWSTVSAGAMSSPVNRKVAQLSKQVARLNRAQRDVEVKQHYTDLAFLIDATGEVPATGQLGPFPTQGTSSQQRVGRKITARSIQIRGGALYAPGAAANATTTVHIYCILDRQCNGAAAGVLDVFTDTNLNFALRDPENISRFKVLWHWVYTYSAVAGVTGAYNSQTAYFDWYKKISYPFEFDAGVGAVTDLVSNNIFLMAGSDGNSDDLVTVAGKCVINFTDD